MFADQPKIPTPHARAVAGRDIGLALSGGGFRAIAFHLGCLRALHEHGLLSRVRVISSVSGGSIIAAMYAYWDDDFDDFDLRVQNLLRQGLLSTIVRRSLFGVRGLRSLLTLISAGTLAAASDTLRTLSGITVRLFGAGRVVRDKYFARIQPPVSRWSSRTNALEDELDRILFGGMTIDAVKRSGIDVVINACELRSGAAFRFGSLESSCWRYGRVVGNGIKISTAVAASAAYPVLLPCLDKTMSFSGRDGSVEENRVFLTDGGVFDNLGTSCLEPNRQSEFSSNVFSVPYIVACDAGRGLFSTKAVPYLWPFRMIRSFEAVMRKAQDARRSLLIQYANQGIIRGLLLPYLGSEDRKFTNVPSDFVRRNDVWDYPTNFSAMSQADINKLALRGEQLTRILLVERASNW